MGRKVGGRLKSEETYVYLWLIHAYVWQKPTQFLYSKYPSIKKIKTFRFIFKKKFCQRTDWWKEEGQNGNRRNQFCL